MDKSVSEDKRKLGKQFHGFTTRLGQLWPALPFLSYGVLMAWVSIAYSGTSWLSDVEVDGTYLGQLYMLSTFALALAFLAAAFLPHKVTAFFEKKSVVITGGVVASFGAFLIYIVGPYYLGAIFDDFTEMSIFYLGCVLTGLGTGVFSIRIAMIYSAIPPRRTLMYAGASQLTMVFIYFLLIGSPDWAIVPGGPSTAGVIAFVFLPLLAAVLINVPSPLLENEPDLVDYRTSFGQFPKTFIRLVLFIFIVALAAIAIRGELVSSEQLQQTVRTNNVLMLLWVPMSAFFIGIAIFSNADRFNFGYIYTVVASVLVLALMIMTVMQVTGAVFVIVAAVCNSVIEMTLWCMSAFIVYQRKLTPLKVFGVCNGVYALARAIGWGLGMYGFRAIESVMIKDYVLLIMAALVLVAGVVLFTEKAFAGLFAPDKDQELGFESLVGKSYEEVAQKTPGAPEEGQTDAHENKTGPFRAAVATIAERYKLSPRETDVFKLLAMGHGGDFIAEELSVSWNTVRTHTHNIYVKLDVHSRDALIALVEKERATHSNQ